MGRGYPVGALRMRVGGRRGAERQLPHGNRRPTCVLMKVSLGVATLALGFAGGVQLHHAVAGEPALVARAIDPAVHAGETAYEDCPRLPAEPPYPVNDNGMTYGSGAGIDADDPGPDLVSAYGSDGRCGFVRAADRPQPALTLAGALAAPTSDGREIPLYAQDGVTVIGVFRR